MTLAWQNENAQSSYPLTKDLFVNDFIVDASFVQFNNFVPTLKSITVKDDAVRLVIKFDTEDLVVSIPSNHTPGTSVRITSSRGHIGRITISYGIEKLYENFLNKSIELNIPFMATVVTSIPTTAGLYSIDGKTGALEFSTDENMWFNVTGNTVEWNSVGKPPTKNITVLKTINGVPAVANNINLEDIDILKFKPIVTGLEANIVTSPVNDNISPQKHYE